MLQGKHILLGVTGGIAAYKSALLIREFVKAGADVQVVMTRSATQFITPLTLSTLSKRKVLIEMFPASPDQPTDQWTEHIDLALWADVMLIAPATANTIAKIRNGLADDFLSTLVLALRGPLVIAPTMDVDMFLNETTQQNIDALRESGSFIIEPASGELASGLTGPGRLPEIDLIVKAVEGILINSHRDYEGKKVLVTAGGTHEPIDPVRYIGNHSSGKMGFALARAAAQRGADVVLVSGPVSLGTPKNVRRIDVATAVEMQNAVEAEFASAHLVIMAAAVADFTPAHPELQKIKRGKEEQYSLILKQNPDILKSLGKKKSHQKLVGFALETNDGENNAREKMASKNLDAIVLNNPNESGAGFNADTNIVSILTADGSVERLPMMSKFAVANEVLNRARKLLV